MSITMTATETYKETLKPATVAFIEENCGEGEYELADALEFIAEHNEDDFVQFYDEYIEQGEKVDYDTVDAFIKENGIVNVEYCEDAFAGCYSSEADFVEDYLENVLEVEVPVWVCVDYQATWDSSVRFDYDFVDGYVFRSDY
jgi:hypothetical protein